MRRQVLRRAAGWWRAFDGCVGRREKPRLSASRKRGRTGGAFSIAILPKEAVEIFCLDNVRCSAYYDSRKDKESVRCEYAKKMFPQSMER